VGCVEWKKSKTIHKHRMLPTSTIGLTLFVSMVEDYELQI
jgi:hypothetical protein